MFSKWTAVTGLATAFLVVVPSLASCTSQEQEQTQVVHYELGSDEGMLSVVPSTGRTCLEGVDPMAKAVDLHLSRKGLTDPVLVSFFEPPEANPGRICETTLSVEDAVRVTTTPSDFYIDLHFSEHGRPRRLALTIDS